MPDLIIPTNIRRVADKGETLIQEFFLNPRGGGAVVASVDGDSVFALKQLIGSRDGPREEISEEELRELPPALRERLRREGFHADVEFGRVGPGTPLGVMRGDRVRGEIQCSVPASHPEGTIFATLKIDGLGTPISVPFALTVGQVRVELLMRPVMIRRGQTLDLPVRVTFPPGTPAATIEFELRGQHCRVDPQFITVPEGGTVVSSVKLVADRDAPVGTLADRWMTTRGFDGPGLEDSVRFDIVVEAASPESTPTMTGTWVGSSGDTTVTMRLTQTGTSVSGTASLQGVPDSFVVNGANNFPNVQLNGAAFGLPTKFAGTFDGPNAVRATLTIEGFDPRPVTITRQ